MIWFLGYFSDRKSNKNIIGKLADVKPFVIENQVDEIYCSPNKILKT
jgi:putative colanic acid biosynthesis UDP-glucose lipid carrier transferase